jgi:predicted transcriptional regulator
MQDFESVRVGSNKTQIVYSCNLNFHTVVPYLDLIIKNGLAERVEGEHIRYRITPKGVKALRHMRELGSVRRIWMAMMTREQQNSFE